MNILSQGWHICLILCVMWSVTSDFQEKVNLGSVEACHLSLQCGSRLLPLLSSTPVVVQLCSHIKWKWGNWRGVRGRHLQFLNLPVWFWCLVVFDCRWATWEFNRPTLTAGPDWDGKRDNWKERKPLDQTMLGDFFQSTWLHKGPPVPSAVIELLPCLWVQPLCPLLSTIITL